MSHLTAATIAPGRTGPGMMGRHRTGKQTLVGSRIVVAIALAIFLSWLFFRSGSNSFSVSEAGRSGGGFDGGADSRDEAAVIWAASALVFLTSGGSANAAHTLGTRQIISLDLLFLGAYRLELRKKD